MGKYTKVINQIFETNDLEKFRLIEANRDFTIRKNLVDDLKEFGGFEYPIMVNEFFEVIDGQNRLAAAKHLDLPIQFFINKGANKRTVIRVNSNSVNWKIIDYIKSFASEGLHDYVLLLNNLNDPRSECLNPTAIISFSSGQHHTYNSNEIKKGLYSIGSQKRISDFLTFISNLSRETGIKSFKDKASKSIFRLWKLKGIDRKRLFEVLKRPNIAEALEMTTEMNYLIPAILSEYNKHLSEKNRIVVYYNEEKRVVIPNEE